MDIYLRLNSDGMNEWYTSLHQFNTLYYYFIIFSLTGIQSNEKEKK